MRYMLAFGLSFAFSMLTVGTAAQAASIVGTWVGGGVVTLKKTGRRERVRCRITYRKGSGKSFGLSASCASTGGSRKSGRGRVVQSRANGYAGRLYDTDHAVSGNIVVTVRGKRQTVSMRSSKGSGTLTLRKR